MTDDESRRKEMEKMIFKTEKYFAKEVVSIKYVIELLLDQPEIVDKEKDILEENFE